MELEKIQRQLCSAFCEEIKIIKHENRFIIDTPFTFPDGDGYQIYLKEIPIGGFRLTDGGHTLMHLSYENDLSSFRTGNRNILLENIKSEFNLKEEEGEFYLDCLGDEIATSIFTLGQAITKISDITFLNRARVQKTFYEDLDADLIKIIAPEKIERNYIFQKLTKPEDYPIDYRIKNEREDYFFLFGVANKDKAQLTTIILERILRKQLELKNGNNSFLFNSLIIVDDMESIQKTTLARLFNVSDSLATFNDKENFKRKVEKFAA